MAITNQNLFSEHIFSSSFQEEFKEYWNSQSNFKSTKFEIISEPFKICRIPNFVKTEFLENLKDELMKHDFNRLHTDLYQFEKSDDLVNMTGDYIPMLYESFQSTLTSWMECNTNIKLNGKISMSSARYNDTHHLLCHDDNMGDRRIAYILYLSKDWMKQDGGALDIFNVDQHGAPDKVVKSLIPEYNSLVFFEVVNNSYHQVGEVLANAKCRWSINGWFHGPIRNDYRKQSRYEIAKNLLEPSVTEVKLNSWITEHYLLSKITKQIQRNFEKTSHALLKNFLTKSTYQQIANDLTSQDITWKMIGPADMRHYEVADEKTLSKPLIEFCNLFKSISFFQLLKKYTELDLVPENATANSDVKSPKMKLELQRWSAGCYTLLYDRTMLEDATDEIDADMSDELINADNEVLCSTAPLDDTSSPSTAKDKRIRDEVHQQSKRKKSESSLFNKKKMVKYSNTQTDVDRTNEEETRNANETLLSRATKSDGLEESATGSSLHKLKAISSDDKVNVNFASDSEENEKSDLIISDDDDDSSNDDNSDSTRDGYWLELIIQFNTANNQGRPKTEDTIDYINPSEEQGTIIQVPQRDNHLCLAYISPMVCRLQHYMNHFYDGYTYTLLCMYYE